MLGPPILVAAIRHGRLDVVEDVYQNCIYLPNLARSENSTINMPVSIRQEHLDQVISQIDSLSHLEKEKQERLKNILYGKVASFKFTSNRCSLKRFCRNLNLLVFALCLSMFLYLATILIIDEEREWQMRPQDIQKHLNP